MQLSALQFTHIRKSLTRMAQDRTQRPISEEMLRAVVDGIPELSELAQAALITHYGTIPAKGKAVERPIPSDKAFAPFVTTSDYWERTAEAEGEAIDRLCALTDAPRPLQPHIRLADFTAQAQASGKTRVCEYTRYPRAQFVQWWENVCFHFQPMQSIPGKYIYRQKFEMPLTREAKARRVLKQLRKRLIREGSLSRSDVASAVERMGALLSTR